jgi:hypothetical protein
VTRPVGDPPGRLLESDATDFERRVLEAALQQKPSKASTARMAAALGVSATAIGTATTAKALAAGAAASKGTAAGASVVWPWMSAGVAVLVVGGVVVGTRSGEPARVPHAAPPAVTAPKDPVPARQLPAPPPAPADTPAPSPAGPAIAAAPRARAVAAAGDLADQVALIDSARAAVSGGAGARALEILRRYQERYPAGSFRPEAAAIKIEALMKLGRESEARALAERFVAEHRGSLLARRVAEVAGLAQP